MKKTILIIDDEPEIVEVLTEFVQQIGYNSLSASNGLQGLEVAKQLSPDLIISDINMPKMNGLEMLEKLNSSGLGIPVILFTAFSDIQKIKTAWKLGAFDFVEKPIDLGSLHKIIDNALHFGTGFKGNQNESKMFSKVDPASIELKVNVTAELHEKLKQQAATEGQEFNAYLVKKLSQ